MYVCGFVRALCALFSDIFLQTAKTGCAHVLIIWRHYDSTGTVIIIFQSCRNNFSYYFGKCCGANGFVRDQEGAQTTAAPLAPTMTEPDVLDALDQFNAKYLILFEDIDAPGIKDAFEKDRKATIHYVRISGPDRPGQFEFISEQVPNFSSLPKLSNPANANCLLLHTSGTMVSLLIICI
jgi:hypothetical protein